MIALEICLQFIAACLGTIAFSAMFIVPARYYPDSCVIGALGWLICWGASDFFGLSTFTGTLAAAVFVSVAARVQAGRRKCPATLFLIPVIFPLVPGVSFYRFIYYMVVGMADMGNRYGRTALSAALAIVIGIMCAYEIPQWAVNRIAETFPIRRRRKKPGRLIQFMERHGF